MIAIVIGLVLLLLLFLITFTPWTAILVSKNNKLVPIYKVATDEKKLAISFDACWGATRTDKLLDILDEYGIKTTFFLVNIWLEDYPENAKEIVARGHEIGMHSVSHPDFTKISADQIKKELLENQKMIKDITGFEANLFRPPFGAYNNQLIQICNELGIYPIQWSVDSLDWKSITADAMVKRVTERSDAGDIILFHNDGENTPDALVGILENFKERGLQVVPISELIYKDDYYIDVNGVQHTKKAQ
jgi:polysaccharide deacetylase family sporulation protein PdaB